MNRITQESSEALLHGQTYRKDNTRVEPYDNGHAMYLHNNRIAYYIPYANILYLSNAGWQTRVTNDRLNGILETFGIIGKVYQEKHILYLWLSDSDTLMEFDNGQIIYTGDNCPIIARENDHGDYFEILSSDFLSSARKSLTLDEAKNLGYGDMLYAIGHYNADNTPMRLKVNGKAKVWKRSPKRVRVPYKRGLYEYGYIEEHDLYLVSLSEYA